MALVRSVGPSSHPPSPPHRRRERVVRDYSGMTGAPARRRMSGAPSPPRAGQRRTSRSEEIQQMFERFTDRARRVVVLAQEEARMLNHNYIGTEHILLGLIHEGEGVAAKALESLGISLEGVR